MEIKQVRPWFDEREIEQVQHTLESGWVTEGPACAEFSRRLNELIGVEYGVFAPNGTLALVLALMALGIGEGDEVLVPDVTFVASATSVMMVGATPVFVDVSKNTYQLDVERCEEKLTSFTRAVMPVHLFGATPDMAALLAFAHKHDLLMIEDAAQAIGVKYGEVHAGRFGDAGCFSFFADKTVTTGEGGYVVCKDGDIYERLLSLRNQGRERRGSYTHPSIGYNFRITDLQGAIGCCQLDKLDQIMRRKKTIERMYLELLDGLAEVEFLAITDGSDFVPFRMVLFAERANFLMVHLERDAIQTRPFFTPLHRQPCFGYAGLDDGDFPNAMDGYKRGLLLPCHPLLSDEDVRYICHSVRDFYR